MEPSAKLIIRVETFVIILMVVCVRCSLLARSPPTLLLMRRQSATVALSLLLQQPNPSSFVKTTTTTTTKQWVVRPASAAMLVSRVETSLMMDTSSFGRKQQRLMSRTMAVEEDKEEEDSTKTVDSEWNIVGLKKEVQRMILRHHKKIGKAHERLKKAKETVEELTTNPDVTLEELDQSPNVDSLELELKELQNRLEKLNDLESKMKDLKTVQMVLPLEVARLALELGVDDQPPQLLPVRNAPKPKGPKKMESYRLPYRRYFSLDNIEIRVGKGAQDNDELTLKHRSNTDFWMHAAGCPGSHVVICAQGRNELPEQVIQDAAALAARHSKASHQATVNVSLTRCRDVIKPALAKPGLVQLTGKVRTISVNMKQAQTRLERLDSTVLIN